MRILRYSSLLCIGSALAVTLHSFSPAAKAEPARSADAFVDFVGVNTHVGYADTTYGDYEGILKPRLLELGVRHIRDGTFDSDVLRKYLDLGRARDPAPAHHRLKTGPREGAQAWADALCH